MSLESSYGTIETWLTVFTTIVVVGLVFEYRDGLKKLFTTWPIDWKHALTMAGAIAVVIGVAGELFTEYKASGIEGKLESTNTSVEQLLFSAAQNADREIAEDNKVASSAASDAAKLGVDVKGLHDYVSTQEGSLTTEMTRVQTYTDTQMKQARTVIAQLHAEQGKLDKASNDALASASQAQAALAEVNKAKSELTNAVTTITKLQDEVHDLTTDRVLTPGQVEQLKDSAGLAGKFVFDMSSSRDADSVNLAIQIAKTLKDAGWDWQARGTLDSIGGPDVPMIGSYFGRNVAAGSCASKWDQFLPAVNAIYNILPAFGIPVTGDKEDDVDGPKRGFACDRLHVFVGSKH